MASHRVFVNDCVFTLQYFVVFSENSAYISVRVNKKAEYVLNIFCIIYYSYFIQEGIYVR